MQNSGRIITGKYLHRTKVAKPKLKVNGETEYYDVDDFYIGRIYFSKELLTTEEGKNVTANQKLFHF